MGQVPGGVERTGAQNRYFRNPYGMGWDIQAVAAACLLWQMVNYIPSYFKWHPLGIIVLTLLVPLFTNYLGSELKLRMSLSNSSRSWGSNQRRGWRRRSRFHTRFLPTPLASFPEPHCSIQPALLFTKSALCPRPGHVTWLAATGSHGNSRVKRYI
jgi:hypothetical protein